MEAKNLNGLEVNFLLFSEDIPVLDGGCCGKKSKCCKNYKKKGKHCKKCPKI